MTREDVQLVEGLVAAAPDDMREAVESEQLLAGFATLLDPAFEFVLAGRGGDVGLEQAMGVGGVYGRPRSGGSEIEVETASVWRFRDGKLLRLEAYTDRPSALRAAGLAS